MEVRTVSQNKMTSECWPVQVWGMDQCKTCEFKKRGCGGKNIRQTGKNAKGHTVPLS